MSTSYQTTTTTTTTTNGAALGVFGLGFFLFFLAIYVIAVAGMWKTFKKAGQPGWAAIVPFYNIYILTKVAGRPGWWVILYLVPIVNIVVGILLALDVAKAFGKGMGFAIFGLIIFNPIGYLLLGFGKAQYQNSRAAGSGAPTMPTTTPPAAPTAPVAPPTLPSPPPTIPPEITPPPVPPATPPSV